MPHSRPASAGLPVPGGIHVTTEGYRPFVADNSLRPAILEAVRAVSLAQPSTLETAALAIADLFAGAAMPPGSRSIRWAGVTANTAPACERCCWRRAAVACLAVSRGRKEIALPGRFLGFRSGAGHS